MAKKIVLCFDGTWNDPGANTNVIKMYKSILGEDKSPGRVGVPVPTPNENTIKWYDKGVGTARGNKIRGGLTGRGLSRNILEGYKFLVDNYEDDDRIYLFGFSRGAYTARSLAGLIRNIGILHKVNAPEAKIEDNPVLMNGFWIYQRRDAYADTEEAIYFRQKYSIDNAEIHFLGIWDTVGAMGIPSNNLDKVDRRYEFHDTELSRRVKNAYHALSIDETRPEFVPTLWTSKPKEGQRVEQVWFAGVHSEIGGGKRPSLTDIPLRWMQEKAIENHLELDPDQIVCIRIEHYIRAQVSNHFAPPWQNAGWNPLGWNYYSLAARVRRSRPHRRPIGGTPVECVHDLVRQKIDAPNSSYKPTNHGLESADTCPGVGDEWECV